MTPTLGTPAVETPSAGPLARFAAAGPLVLPSLLKCDFGHIADEIASLEQAGVQALHLDIMDGHFVPNLSYGLPVVEAVRKLTNLPLDLHLMIDNPGDYVKRYRDAGADLMTIHIEAVPDPKALLGEIRRLGAAAGLALNPQTPISAIEPYLADCDVVLVMSVEPGFGGQEFEPVAVTKLQQLRAIVGSDKVLEVDGGIHEKTIGRCAAAGADWFVAGSAVFGAPDYGAEVRRLRELAAVR
ncbi:MAG: ribulose-phosphate 3-epimerase [Planctomycetia bacterium]|nr:ribulose-phosphate 3-epimerase [Planctomycetia bacterium]